jgi:hypothetical protein
MKVCAPIAVNTAEEVYKHATLIANKKPSVFLEGWATKVTTYLPHTHKVARRMEKP